MPCENTDKTAPINRPHQTLKLPNLDTGLSNLQTMINKILLFISHSTFPTHKAVSALHMQFAPFWTFYNVHIFQNITLHTINTQSRLSIIIILKLTRSHADHSAVIIPFVWIPHPGVPPRTENIQMQLYVLNTHRFFLLTFPKQDYIPTIYIALTSYWTLWVACG